MPAATDRHCLVAGHIPGGAVDPVASATPPRSSRGCDPQKVWRCGSYVESPGDGSVLIRHEAVAERGRRYRRQVTGYVFTSWPSAFAMRLETASLKCLVLAFSLSHRFRFFFLSRSQVTSPPLRRYEVFGSVRMSSDPP